MRRYIDKAAAAGERIADAAGRAGEELRDRAADAESALADDESTAEGSRIPVDPAPERTAGGEPVPVTSGRADRSADGSATAPGPGDRPAPAVSDIPDAVSDVPDAVPDVPDAVRRSAADVGSAIRRSVGGTLQRADTRETGTWALSGGAWLLAPALVVAHPTSLVVGAGVLGGAVVGAYASANEGTPLDDVDPTDVPKHAAIGAARGRQYGHHGVVAGALLGGGLHVAGSAVPEEYADWVVDLDPEVLLFGLANGAARADSECTRDLIAGSAAGGALGAAYSYAEGLDEDVDRALRELLDDDLYREYVERLDELAAGDAEGGLGRFDPAGDDPALGDAAVRDLDPDEFEWEDGSGEQ